MKKVMFVCTGNICRSPAAEAIFKKIIKENSLENQFDIQSSGTSAYHIGELADGRMRDHGKQRGYDLTSISQQFDSKKDWENFDYIITMDESNYRSLRSLDKDQKYTRKLSKMTSYCIVHDVLEVPDPYYGGAEGFELTYDILEDACNGLFEKLKR